MTDLILSFRGRSEAILIQENPPEEKFLGKPRAPLGNNRKTEKSCTWCNIESKEDYEVRLTCFYVRNWGKNLGYVIESGAS